MPTHKKHDPSDLDDALEHIVYEAWKYKQSVAHFRKIMSVGGDAAIEFRVLHHRVLLEFFYGPAKHQDNIVAWEYIDDWKQGHDKADLKWFDEYTTRCHTMLAHISKARSEIAKRGQKSWGKDWPIVEAQLDSTIADFFAGLSDHHKKICFKWLEQWSAAGYQGNGNDVLPGLVALIRLT